MRPVDLARIGAGFSDPVLGAQQAFRAALRAISHPGRTVALLHDAQAPAGVGRAAAGMLLALLDADTRLWLGASHASTEVGAWLRFHTGCEIVGNCAQADFAWVRGLEQWTAAQMMRLGTDSDPDRSTSCLIDLPGFTNPDGHASAWRLSGPGVNGEIRLLAQAPEPARQAFLSRWHENHAIFPRGVDVYLATSDRIAGLPRTTRIEACVGGQPCM